MLAWMDGQKSEHSSDELKKKKKKKKCQPILIFETVLCLKPFDNFQD